MHVTVSKTHQKLVVPALPAVQNLFPGAPVLPDGNSECIVLPHRMHETKLLRHLGFKLPNPMIAYYDWKGGKPFGVQRKTCALLSENPRAYVLNHMGTGKTKAALWTWDYLHDQGLVGKLLVVAPLSTLNFVWAREVFATLPHRKCLVLHGSKSKRLERLEEDADIYVINHDGLKVIGDHLHARVDINVLVLDELAVYRNKSQRSRTMWKFAERFPTVWGMSGAPMPNEPTDVWSQCKIVTPATVPKYYRHAEQMLMTRISTFVMVPKPDAVNTAFSWMQPAVRYALDDVVELPPVIERTIDVDLSAQQKRVYEKVLKELRVMVEQKEITALNAGAAMAKLLQIACGWVYSKNPEFVTLDATPRISALLDLIQSAERKVMVLVPFRHALAGIADELTKAGIDHCVVHGGTTNRDNLFNLFQNTTKYKVLLAHPECLAHGLTLTAADTIIWYCPIANLDIYDQANARIRRYGQAHKQQVLHLCGTPVERKLYALLSKKQKVQNQLLSLFEEATMERQG